MVRPRRLETRVNSMNSFYGVCLRLSAGALQIRIWKEGFRCQNGDQKVSKTSQMKAKGTQNEPRNLQKHSLRNRFEKVMNGGPRRWRWVPIFEFKSINILKNTIQRMSQKPVTEKHEK